MRSLRGHLSGWATQRLTRNEFRLPALIPQSRPPRHLRREGAYSFVIGKRDPIPYALEADWLVEDPVEIGPVSAGENSR